MVTSSDVARLFYKEEEEPDDTGTLKVCTIRMDAGRIAYIDSMAENAGVSRNVMCNHLLGVGIGAVLAELPDEIREGVEEGVVQRVEGL